MAEFNTTNECYTSDVIIRNLNIKTNEYGDVEKYSSYINNPRYFDISRNLTFNLNGVTNSIESYHLCKEFANDKNSNIF